MCEIDQCNNKHFGRGMCSKHYTRWRKEQNPLSDQPCSECKEGIRLQGRSFCGECQRQRSYKNYYRRMDDPQLKAQTNEKKREYLQRIRLEVLSYYGGKCLCCGELESVFLTLDHIKDDGAEHRREDTSVFQAAVWAKRNNYPEIFQVLCHNCNWGKRMGGCPHDRGRNDAL